MNPPVWKMEMNENNSEPLKPLNKAACRCGLVESTKTRNIQACRNKERSLRGLRVTKRSSLKIKCSPYKKRTYTPLTVFLPMYGPNMSACVSLLSLCLCRSYVTENIHQSAQAT